MSRFIRLTDKKGRQCIDVISVNWSHKYPIILNETEHSILCKRESLYSWGGNGQDRLIRSPTYLIFIKSSPNTVDRILGDWEIEYGLKDRLNKLKLAKEMQIKMEGK